MGQNSTPGGSTRIPSCCHWWWSCCCCHCSGSFYTDNVVAPSPTGSIPDFSNIATGSSTLPAGTDIANTAEHTTGQLALFATPFGPTVVPPAAVVVLPAEPLAPPEDSANLTLYSNHLDKECLLNSGTPETRNHVAHETDPKPYQENYDYRAYRDPELYDSELECRDRGDCESYTEGMSGTDSYEGGPPASGYLGSYQRIRHLSGLSEGPVNGPYPSAAYSMGPYPAGPGYRSGDSQYSGSQYGGSPDRFRAEFGVSRGEMDRRYSEYEMQRTLQRGEVKPVPGILKRPPGEGEMPAPGCQEDTGGEEESAYNEHFKHSELRAGPGEYRVPSVRVRPVQTRYSSSSPIPGGPPFNGPIVTQPESNHGSLGNGKKSPFLEREVNLPRDVSGSWDSPGQTREGEAGEGVANQAQERMDRLQLEMNPPLDRWNLMYLTLVLHGVGTLMPWNIFINAKTVSYQTLARGDWQYLLPDYFVHYKLGQEYTDIESSILPFFLQYLALAAQLPNVIFNWMNVFLQLSGNLSPRIVWTLLVEILVLILTIVLAMVETVGWPNLFFYLTLGSVVLLSMANGMYQNTVYGLAARLPFRYTGAVVLGSNLSGTIVSLINLLCISLSPNPRTAAIYYFITALFMLLACFDTYFALPLNRFYRYHEHLHHKSLAESQKSVILVISYWDIAKKCRAQLLNIMIVFGVTLAVFPAVLSDVDRVYGSFFVSREYFVSVACFLTFNACSVVGNILPNYITWPSPGRLVVPALCRLLFIPLFLLCNYRPSGVERLWPVLFHWDGLYWFFVILFGISGGYTASLALMYCPRSVDPEYASIAGMMGAAAIGVGILLGLATSCLMPVIVSSRSLDWELPGFWPAYHPD